MHTVFSTDGIHPHNTFRRWREVLGDQLVPAEMRSVGDAPFQGRIQASTIGPMAVTEIANGAMRTESTADHIRRSGRDDQVVAVMRLSGGSACQQGDREAVFGAGDLVVFDPRPGVSEAQAGCSLIVTLPRERFEALLGPSRLYTALTVGADLASTTLASTFIQELVRVGDRLTSDAAARMALIGTDLIVASLAERMAQGVPRSIHGTVTVQRAKAYVEANLSDPNLDPRQLAAAMGLSLRRLQELFHERGRHISDYIWERRLEAAARRLADPACAHVSIGTLAYDCGFASQAHFARRFKARHGMAPREYRIASAMSGSKATAHL